MSSREDRPDGRTKNMSRRSRLKLSFSAGLGIGVLAGVVFVVLLAQCGGERVSSIEKREHDDLVLGKVAGIDFTVADLRRKLKYQYGRVAETGVQGVSEQRSILQSAIDEWCWVKFGEKKGYDQDPQFQDTWELSRRYILANRTIDREVRERSEPTEEEIQAYYAENLSEYRMPARVQISHVQTATKAQAETARRRLLAGEIVGDVVRDLTIDEMTRANGGVLGWVSASSAAGHLGMLPDVNDAAMKLQKGEVSPVIPLGGDRGWTVLYCLDRSEEGPRALDDAVRETIVKRVQTRKHNKIFEELLTQLKKEYGAEVYAENFRAS
jgi:hypothetical protein